MPKNNCITRRQSLKAALIPIAATTLFASAQKLKAQTNSDTAVIFLSRSGNTHVLAEALSRRLNADLFEVQPRDPWPADYEEMVEWATRMREQESDLPLAEMLELSPYRTVFLGTPVWGGDLPAVMASFLRSHDMSAKTVIPFITHGGYGPGDTMRTAAELAPNADFGNPFVLRCDQERDTLRQLDDWLENEVEPT